MQKLYQVGDLCRHSLAYKDLLNVSSEPIDVPAVDANRMYSLTDYCTLSTLRDAAIWPPPSPSDISQGNRGVETSDGFVLVDILAAGMDPHENSDLNTMRNFNEQHHDNPDFNTWRNFSEQHHENSDLTMMRNFNEQHHENLDFTMFRTLNEQQEQPDQTENYNLSPS